MISLRAENSGTDENHGTHRRQSRFWVTRRGALESVHELLDSQVVLLRGPAGAGKSALIRQLADSLVERGRAVFELEPTDAADAPALLVRIRDCGAESRPVLFVDADSLSTADEELIQTLIDELPDMTTVVATRARTVFELASSAVRVDTALVDLHILLFDDETTAAVFRANGREITRDQAHYFSEELGGWAKAIQLAATLVRLEQWSIEDDADRRSIIDHTLRELTSFTIDPADLDDALALRLLAAVDSVSIELLRVLSEHTETLGTGAEEAMRRLEVRGIGRIVRVARSTRFELASAHRREILLRTQDLPTDRVVEFFSSVAESAATAGDTTSALQIAVHCRLWELAVSVLERRIDVVIAGAEPAVEAALAMIPTEFLERSLELSTALQLRRLDEDASVARLGRMERSLERLIAAHASVADPDAEAALRITVLESEVRRRLGQFGRAVELADQIAQRDAASGTTAEVPDFVRQQAGRAAAVALIHMKRPREARWRLPHTPTSASRVEREAAAAMAMIDLLQGDVTTAVERVAAWKPLAAEKWGPTELTARAFLHLESGEFARASALLDRVDAECPYTEFWALASALQVWAALMADDRMLAGRLLQQALARHTHQPMSPYLGGFLQAARSDVMVVLRRPRTALELSRSAVFVGEATAGSLARALLMSGQAQQAGLFSTQRLATDALSTRAGVELLLTKAIVDARSGSGGTARESLDRAVALSISHRLELPWRFIASEDRRALTDLAPGPDARRLLSLPHPIFRDALTMPRLSQRELVVLSAATHTSSTAALAAALNVSMNTVKSQLRSAYRKLDVANRADAIRSAHEWGILRTTSRSEAADLSAPASAGQLAAIR